MLAQGASARRCRTSTALPGRPARRNALAQASAGKSVPLTSNNSATGGGDAMGDQVCRAKGRGADGVGGGSG